MFGKRLLPVYLFTGFLDSGKTSFIRETLLDGQFQDGKTTLLIICEEGEEELETELLKKNEMEVRMIEDEEDVSRELLKTFDAEVRPARVIIEENGTWDVREIVESFPENWTLGQGIATVDSNTYEMYLSNMKQMMMNQFAYADLVLFNRCTEEHDRAMFKRTVRAVNKRAQVLYETPDGNVDDEVEEELPYDISADLIEIGDDDFGIFYLDALDNLEQYEGKTVTFKGQVFHPKRGKEDVFIPGRFAMTCCADDIAFFGFPCKYGEAKRLRTKEWVKVTAKIGSAMSREYQRRAPVLYASVVETTQAAEDELVYFN